MIVNQITVTGESVGEGPGPGGDGGPSLPPSHLLQVFAQAFSPIGLSHAPFPFHSSHFSEGALSAQDWEWAIPIAIANTSRMCKVRMSNMN